MSGESGEGGGGERGMQHFDSANQNKGADVDRERYETYRVFRLFFSRRHSKFYTPGLNPPPLGPHG